MTRTYTLRAFCPVGLGEIPCEITFSYYPGCPEQGPSYASGGQPAEDASIEFHSAEFLDQSQYPWPNIAQTLLENWATDYLTTDAGLEAAADVVEGDWNE